MNMMNKKILAALWTVMLAWMLPSHAQTFNIRLGNGLKMDVEACSEQIYRIRITPTDTFPESLMERYGLLETNWVPTKARLRDQGTTATLRNGKYMLDIRKDDGTLTVRDKAGREIIQSIRFIPSTDQQIRVMGDSLNKRFMWCKKRYAIIGDPTSKEYTANGLDAGDISHNSMLSFSLRDNERMYGGGTCSRRHIQHRGEVLRMWTQSQVAQMNIPFLYSSEGWGVLNNTTLRHYFDVGVTKPDQMLVYNTTNTADYYLLLGQSMPDAINLYTQLTGRSMMLPRWAYGASFCGIEIENIIDVLNDAVRFREEQVPLDMIWIEPQWMNKRYHNKTDKDWNYDLMPGVPKWGKDSHSECNNLLVGRLHGLGYKTALWLYVDFDHSVPAEDAIAEAAGRPTSGQEHWMDHLMKFVDQGVDGYKLDPGKTIAEHPKREYYNGKTDSEMHNLNQVLMPKQLYQKFSQHTNRRPFHHYCGGWAGIQHWSASTSGDNGGGVVALFDQLNLGMSGYLNTSCDVLSFDFCTEMQALHFGMFIPWVQINGWFHMLQPWYFPPKEKQAYKEYMELRHDLFPYIYSTALNGRQTGMPILRAMPLVFTDDRNVDDMTCEYMFGDNLLVGVFSDSIYLPKGNWMNYWDGTIHEGKERTEQISLPEKRYGHLFVREGAIIPYQPRMQYIGESPMDTLIVRVYPSQSSTFTLYEDDGLSLGYQQSVPEIASTQFDCTQRKQCTEFVVNPVKGYFKGMYDSRTYQMEFLNMSEPKAVKINGKEATDWTFSNGKLRVTANQPDTHKKLQIKITH